MIMKIQFKKLVWANKRKSKFTCENTLCSFSITRENTGLYDWYLEIRTTDPDGEIFYHDYHWSVENAKEDAQRWFEEQLTQFIETSENPAQ